MAQQQQRTVEEIIADLERLAQELRTRQYPPTVVGSGMAGMTYPFLIKAADNLRFLLPVKRKAR